MWDSCSGLISCLFGFATQQQTKKKKVPGRTLRAMCSSGMKSRQLNNTASDCGRASLGRKHFGLSIFFQSSVSDYFLFQIRTLHTPPQHHLPCLRDGCSQDMPCCHLATLNPGKKWCCFHTMPTAHSLSVKRDLSLIWAVRRQAKQRIWLQSSSLSEQDSWNGIQLTSVGLICSYRVNRVQGVLPKYLKYIFPWMLQKWLYNCSPSGKQLESPPPLTGSDDDCICSPPRCVWHLSYTSAFLQIFMFSTCAFSLCVLPLDMNS